MLTATRDEQTALASLGVGASGYVLKDVAPERLAASLRAALDGELVFPRRLLGRALDGLDANGHLSEGDRRVAELLRDGLSSAEMADRLQASLERVRAHVATVARALRTAERPRPLTGGR
jgi:DNA-binding NarL/FixJ family response regulator